MFRPEIITTEKLAERGWTLAENGSYTRGNLCLAGKAPFWLLTIKGNDTVPDLTCKNLSRWTQLDKLTDHQNAQFVRAEEAKRLTDASN